MSDSIFKVYTGSYLTGYGLPTVIISADQESKEVLNSEYFVFIDGENTQFWGGQISINTNNAPKHVIDATISTAIEEALLQAKTTISLNQYDYFQKKNIESWLRDKVELNETEKHVIFRLRNSGKFNDQLAAIKEKSTSEPLQAYISLLHGTSFYKCSDFT